MDALQIEERARALVEQHGDGAKAYVQHHLDAAEAAGLSGAARDWRAMLEAVHHLKG